MSTTTIIVNYKYILGRVDGQCYERLFKAINGKATYSILSAMKNKGWFWLALIFSALSKKSWALGKTIESSFCYEKHQTWKSWTVLNNILEWLLIQQEMQRFLINILLGGLCIYFRLWMPD